MTIRTILSSAGLAVLLASGGAAAAEYGAASAYGTQEQDAEQVGDTRLRGEALLGRTVFTPEGQPVGRVAEVLVADGGQLITLAVLGADGAQPIAVPGEHVEVRADHRIVVDLTEEEWAALPGFESGQPQIAREPAPQTGERTD